LILFIFFISKNYHLLKIVLSSVGLGLVADELVFMIIGNRTISDYWSLSSVFGAIIIIAVVFIFRDKLLKVII